MLEIAAQCPPGKLGDTARWWIGNRSTSIWREYKLAAKAAPATDRDDTIADDRSDPSHQTPFRSDKIAALSGDAKHGKETLLRQGRLSVPATRRKEEGRATWVPI